MKNKPLPALSEMSAEELRQHAQHLECSLTLLSSPEWKEYVRFLDARAATLQHSVNAAVEAGDIVEAKSCLAVLKDSQKQAQVFKQQVIKSKEDLNKLRTKKEV